MFSVDKGLYLVKNAKGSGLISALCYDTGILALGIPFTKVCVL